MALVLTTECSYTINTTIRGALYGVRKAGTRTSDVRTNGTLECQNQNTSASLRSRDTENTHWKQNLHCPDLVKAVPYFYKHFLATDLHPDSRRETRLTSG